MKYEKRIEIRIDEETDQALNKEVEKSDGDIRKSTAARIALKKGLGLKKKC